jgi:hypothetical protein
MVHVKVGSPSQTFTVHKSLICYWSPYFFKPAFTSGFKETSESVIDLAETRTAVFELFNNWLYTSTLPGNPTQETLVHLYVFADMAQIPVLKNLTLRRLNQIVKTGRVLIRHANYVWEHTQENCGLRRYFVDLYAWKATGRGAFASTYMENWNLEICLQILRVMERRLLNQSMKSPLLDMSNYDEPEDDEMK